MAPKTKPAHIRFLEKVKIIKSTDCWIWEGLIQGRGYGLFRENDTKWGRKNTPYIMAHRYSYKIFNRGELPKDKLVCHSCDNKRCVNPFHLFLGTPKDNIQDMIRKGRQIGGINQPFNHVGIKDHGNLPNLIRAKRQKTKKGEK